MAGQQLRQSQFVLNFGPGAILEGPNGPRIVLALHKQRKHLFKSEVQPPELNVPDDWQIGDPRLAHLLNGDIFQIPSNAALGRADHQTVYQTARFPKWSLCPKHKKLYRYRLNTHTSCPECPRGSVQSAEKQANSQAIRFVVACPQGHLNDIPWHWMVHKKNKSCKPEYYHWKGGGGSLKEVRIVCPNCQANTSLLEVYRSTSFCAGSFPENPSENEPLDDEQRCSVEAKVIQRGAAGLYLPEVISALTIPPICSRLHDILSRPDMRREVDAFKTSLQTFQMRELQESDLSLLMNYLETRANAQHLNPATVAALKQDYTPPQIWKAMQEVLSGSALPEDMASLILQEFQALQTAAREGAPAQIHPKDAANRFEVSPHDLDQVSLRGLTFRITPVRRLRVVMALKGYRRLSTTTGERVDVSLRDSLGKTWFPGTELFGEGLFIDFAPNQNLPLSGSSATRWLSLKNQGNTPLPATELFSDPEMRRHPVFIFWHTLAHRLIRACSIDSGYSSAAIRERIYLEKTDEGLRGGILLYTSQPGSDGTLGGLMALAKRIDALLELALEDLDICSNDPLCSDQQPAPEQHSGASCYACSMVSETSCEHRNMFLDRILLQECLHD